LSFVIASSWFSPVARGSNALERRVGVRIQEDRKWLLVRHWRELDILKSYVLTRKCGTPFGEQRAQRSYALVHHAPAIGAFQLGVDRFKFLAVTSDPNA
jgi:hypothetical protein